MAPAPVLADVPRPGDTRALPTPVFPPEVGLHLFDYSVLLGDLVELVSDQAAACISCSCGWWTEYVGLAR